MPLFEYRCDKCKKKTEEVFSIKDDIPGVIKCPKCGKMTAKRVWGGTAIIIPPYFNPQNNPIHYKKSPSGRKHIF